MLIKFNTVLPSKVAKAKATLPLVLVLSSGNTKVTPEQIPSALSADVINSVIESAINTKQLDVTKVSSVVYNNLLGDDSLPSKLGIVVAPFNTNANAEARKVATSASNKAAELVKSFATDSDVNLQIDFVSNVSGLQAPSVIRAISNAVYDYKDSQKEVEPKDINVLTSSIGTIIDEERFDIMAHDHVVYVRDLVTSPPNAVTPEELLEQAKIIAESPKITLVKHNPVKENMAGLLAVSRGSALAPQFIELRYQGNKTKNTDQVFIGKGITFDSGGYSIKPPKSMETMKGDMAGAATVLGLFRWLAENGSDKNIVGLIPTCENMVDAASIVPGEVIQYSNGKTVEVLNTDAEGRLILADALIYSHKFEGAEVIDIATLTGGIVVGLGKYRTGLFGTDEQLMSDIEESGNLRADPVWPMPMDDESYSPKSEVADMPNITPGPSSITAAMFLKEFAPKRWAHLDIAGTSGEAVGTGRPLHLLIEMTRPAY